MITLISEKKKNSIRTTNYRLYEVCGSLNPIIYYIDGLTNQFNSIIDSNDCKAFESKLTEAENKMLIYYNKDGVSKEVAESDAFNHLLVYKVRNTKESEGRYFFHIELANLFIRSAIKKSLDIKHQLSKIFNGYSSSVESLLFFC